MNPAMTTETAGRRPAQDENLTLRRCPSAFPRAPASWRFPRNSPARFRRGSPVSGACVLWTFSPAPFALWTYARSFSRLLCGPVISVWILFLLWSGFSLLSCVLSPYCPPLRSVPKTTASCCDYNQAVLANCVVQKWRCRHGHGWRRTAPPSRNPRSFPSTTILDDCAGRFSQ